MSTEVAFNFLERSRFQQSKKAQIIESFQRIKFSGQLVWIAPDNEKQWNFYFCLGRIMYATGGTHPVRRWARNLAAYCPEIHVDITQLQHEFYRLNPDAFTISCEYHLFCLWIEQHKINGSSVLNVISLSY